jgi:hypothetical protein
MVNQYSSCPLCNKNRERPYQTKHKIREIMNITIHEDYYNQQAANNINQDVLNYAERFDQFFDEAHKRLIIERLKIIVLV